MSSLSTIQVHLPKPYPRHCAKCKQVTVEAVEIAYDAAVNHDGIVHRFQVAQLSIDRCSHCGAEYISIAADDQISAALRTKLGLLHPEQIAQRMAELQLTSAEFANRLGVTQVQVESWLDGREIQSRVLDKLLRLYFGIPAVREFLAVNRLAPETLAPETVAPVEPVSAQ